jgi:putative endonuclease
MKVGYTYIMSNAGRTVFYTGVTNSIERRVVEHRSGSGSLFTSKYKCTDLVYYESFWQIAAAIQREKQIKNRPRKWKIDLIRNVNPEMKDLAADWKMNSVPDL